MTETEKEERDKSVPRRMRDECLHGRVVLGTRTHTQAMQAAPSLPSLGQEGSARADMAALRSVGRRTEITYHRESW